MATTLSVTQKSDAVLVSHSKSADLPARSVLMEPYLWLLCFAGNRPGRGRVKLALLLFAVAVRHLFGKQ